MRTKLPLVSIFAAIAAVVMLEAVPAAAESTWGQIKRTGQLRYGAIDYPPNWKPAYLQAPWIIGKRAFETDYCASLPGTAILAFKPRENPVNVG